MRAECPKCGSASAWIETTPVDVILRCMCGLHKLIATKLQEIEIEHNDEPTQVKLPRPQSHLWFTIMVLSVLKEATSAEITERLIDLGKDFDVSDVSSYLTILRSKSLVYTTEFRRGVVGGSTWKLTDGCLALIGDYNGS